jgi:hypothetical protein
MFKIKVNEAFETYGLISFNIRQEGDNLIREGILKTHLYIEEIFSLECDRFALDGINVTAESFGSSDPFVIYYFNFEEFETFYEELEYEEKELLELYEKEVNE